MSADSRTILLGLLTQISAARAEAMASYKAMGERCAMQAAALAEDKMEDVVRLEQEIAVLRLSAAGWLGRVRRLLEIEQRQQDRMIDGVLLASGEGGEG